MCAARQHVFAFDLWPENQIDKTCGRKAELGTFVNALGKAGIQVILTVWPEPTLNYINVKPCGRVSSLGCLIEFVKNHRKYIYGIELEDEDDNWSDIYMKDVKTGQSDFINLTEASTRLMRAIRTGLKATRSNAGGTNSTPDVGPVKIGVTTNPKNFVLQRLSTDSLLLNSDFISFQTYQPVCTPPPCDEEVSFQETLPQEGCRTEQSALLKAWRGYGRIRCCWAFPRLTKVLRRKAM